MQPLLLRLIAAVTYLWSTYTAAFSVFDAEPKQHEHADLCTPRMSSQIQYMNDDEGGGLQLTGHLLGSRGMILCVQLHTTFWTIDMYKQTK